MKYAWFALAVLLAGVVAWTFVFHLNPALDSWGKSAPDLAPTLQQANALLTLIQRPCASVDAKGHLLPDGPICEIDQMIHDVRKITTSSGEQVKQTGQLISAATVNLNKAGDSVTDLTGHLSKTADAATGFTQELTKTVQTVNDPKTGVAPLLVSFNASAANVADATGNINKSIKENSPILHTFMVSANDMADTSNKFEKKITACTLHPTFPCVFKADAIFAAQMFGYAVR